MQAKIAKNEEGEINPKLENIKAQLKKGWVEVVKEEIKVEFALTKEVEVNNLDDIKFEQKKGWAKVVKGIKMEIEATSKDGQRQLRNKFMTKKHTCETTHV